MKYDNILAIRIFKIQIMTSFKIQIKTKALVYHKMYDLVVERIKYMAFNILTYCGNSSNPMRSL